VEGKRGEGERDYGDSDGGKEWEKSREGNKRGRRGKKQTRSRGLGRVAVTYLSEPNFS